MAEEKKQNKQEKREKEEGKPASILELEEKAKLVDEYLDQLQRVQAEFENYRKRAIKEKDEFRKYVLEGFLYELLDILDNLQRAKTITANDNSSKIVKDGIEIVEKKFLELFKSKGVEPLKLNLGDGFDPHKHHAVGHEPSTEYPPDKIMKILQQGYVIADRVLRPALVLVSSGTAINE